MTTIKWQHNSTLEQLASIRVTVRHLQDMVEEWQKDHGDEDALFDPIARADRDLEEIWETLSERLEIKRTDRELLSKRLETLRG